MCLVLTCYVPTQGPKTCVQTCADAWGEDCFVRSLPVEVLLQVTPVQLVQLCSMLFEPILLYPNKLISELGSFSSRTSPSCFHSPAS